MLAVNLLRASGSKAVDCTFTDSAVSTADATTYTFAGRDLGVAAANRYIVVAAGGYSLFNSYSVSSVTIGGVAASEVVKGDGVGRNVTAIFIAAVPTGATGDIVVTFSNAMRSAGIGVFRLVNLLSAIATDTASDLTETGNALSGSLTIPANGCGIGYVSVDGETATRTFVWTNLTEQFDAVVESGDDVSHSGAMSSTAGTATRTVTASGTIIHESLVLAAWR